jgi:hypothetical protein
MRTSALVLILATGCTQSTQVVDRVTVRNERFEVVRVLDDSASLVRFAELWRSRREVESDSRPLSEFPFKLDIDANHRSGRWLYSADGFTTLLTVKVSKVYFIDDASTLNRILGIDASVAAAH